MLTTVWAVVRDGKVELLEDIEVPDGSRVLVTLLSGDEQFWLEASQTSLDAVWGNVDDDVYADLLKG
jgi:hypothetical protein